MNRSYEVKIIEDDNGIHFETTNSGYNALELLGLYQYKTHDLIRQIMKEIKPDITFKRTYVEEPPKE